MSDLERDDTRTSYLFLHVLSVFVASLLAFSFDRLVCFFFIFCLVRRRRRRRRLWRVLGFDVTDFPLPSIPSPFF